MDRAWLVSLARRGFLEWTPVVLVCVGLALVATWPLPLYLEHYPAARDEPDLAVGVWLLSFVADSLATGSDLANSELTAWPHGQAVDLLVWNYLGQILALPLGLLYSPLKAYNLTIIVYGALNGVAGWVLGREISGRHAGGLAGASVLVFSPLLWQEFAQGRLEQGALIGPVLAVAAVWRIWRGGGLWAGIALGVSWAVAGLFYWFAAYFLGLFLAPLLLVAWRWNRPALRPLVLGGALALVLVSPAVASIVTAMAEADSAWAQTTSEDYARQVATILPGYSMGLRDLLIWPTALPQQLRLVLPVTLFGVLGVAVLRHREARWLATIGVLGLVLALGPVFCWQQGEPLLVGGMQLSLPFAWRGVLPGLSRLWWPYRMAALFYVALAAIAPMLVRGRWAWAIAGGLTLALSGELKAAQAWTQGELIWDSPVRFEAPALFEQLATEPGQHPVLSLPFMAPGRSTIGVLFQGYHRQPTSAGLADGEDFAVSAERARDLAASPALMALQRVSMPALGGPQRLDFDPIPELREMGFHYAVLHVAGRPPELARHVAVLGPPDLQDNGFAIWDLR
jgi:hypothetical protein